MSVAGESADSPAIGAPLFRDTHSWTELTRRVAADLKWAFEADKPRLTETEREHIPRSRRDYGTTFAFGTRSSGAWGIFGCLPFCTHKFDDLSK